MQARCGATKSMRTRSVCPRGPSKVAPKRRVIRAAFTTPTQANHIRNDQDLLVMLAKVFINTPGLFSLVAAIGRNFMRSSAESKGILWGQHVRTLQSQMPLLESIRAEIEDQSLSYPSYFLRPIHGYAQSNLCWDAAMEVEPARRIVSARTYPDLSAADADTKMQDNVLNFIQSYCSQYDVRSFDSILDLGCCTGSATYELAQAYPKASVTGIDLSPHFLAIAHLRQKERVASGLNSTRPIRYIHGLAEKTSLPDASFDFVNIGFVFHECPREASTAILKEAYRLLKPGGVLFIADTNPNCAALQRLHPAIFMLREQSEPWMTEFRQFNVPETLTQVGFKNVEIHDVTERDNGFLALK